MDQTRLLRQEVAMPRIEIGRSSSIQSNGDVSLKSEALAPILGALARALVDLDQIRAIGALNTPATPESMGVWEDPLQYYIEVQLPERASCAIDVSVQGRTLFVRLEK
jgi:hypothetical protein